MTGRTKKRSVLWLFVIMAGLLLLSGCGKKDEKIPADKLCRIYYVNKEETCVVMQEYAAQAPRENTLERLEELLGKLKEIPEKLEYLPPISGKAVLTDYRLDGDQLTLIFEESYKEIIPTTEILLRAAIVRTLTQIEGISCVSFVIGSEPLIDNLGNVVGVMYSEQFIDNAGDEINAYEMVDLHLYYADETGSRLVEANRRLTFNTNISKEKLIVEQIILGPQNASLYPTVNPDTKIVSVTVKDGTCYVNLSQEFLTQTNQVNPEVAIYSIVNSLVELSNVNNVQISVNGETDITFMETVKLTDVFERNLDLVGTTDKAE